MVSTEALSCLAKPNGERRLLGGVPVGRRTRAAGVCHVELDLRDVVESEVRAVAFERPRVLTGSPGDEAHAHRGGRSPRLLGPEHLHVGAGVLPAAAGVEAAEQRHRLGGSRQSPGR